MRSTEAAQGASALGPAHRRSFRSTNNHVRALRQALVANTTGAAQGGEQDISSAGTSRTSLSHPTSSPKTLETNSRKTESSSTSPRHAISHRGGSPRNLDTDGKKHGSPAASRNTLGHQVSSPRSVRRSHLSTEPQSFSTTINARVNSPLTTTINARVNSPLTTKTEASTVLQQVISQRVKSPVTVRRSHVSHTTPSSSSTTTTTQSEIKDAKRVESSIVDRHTQLTKQLISPPCIVVTEDNMTESNIYVSADRRSSSPDSPAEDFNLTTIMNNFDPVASFGRASPPVSHRLLPNGHSVINKSAKLDSVGTFTDRKSPIPDVKMNIMSNQSGEVTVTINTESMKIIPKTPFDNHATPNKPTIDINTTNIRASQSPSHTTSQSIKTTSTNSKLGTSSTAPVASKSRQLPKEPTSGTSSSPRNSPLTPRSKGNYKTFQRTPQSASENVKAVQKFLSSNKPSDPKQYSSKTLPLRMKLNSQPKWRAGIQVNQFSDEPEDKGAATNVARTKSLKNLQPGTVKALKRVFVANDTEAANPVKTASPLPKDNSVPKPDASDNPSMIPSSKNAPIENRVNISTPALGNIEERSDSHKPTSLQRSPILQPEPAAMNVKELQRTFTVSDLDNGKTTEPSLSTSSKQPLSKLHTQTSFEDATEELDEYIASADVPFEASFKDKESPVKDMLSPTVQHRTFHRQLPKVPTVSVTGNNNASAQSQGSNNDRCINATDYVSFRSQKSMDEENIDDSNPNNQSAVMSPGSAAQTVSSCSDNNETSLPPNSTNKHLRANKPLQRSNKSLYAKFSISEVNKRTTDEQPKLDISISENNGIQQEKEKVPKKSVLNIIQKFNTLKKEDLQQSQQQSSASPRNQDKLSPKTQKRIEDELIPSPSPSANKQIKNVTEHNASASCDSVVPHRVEVISTKAKVYHQNVIKSKETKDPSRTVQSINAICHDDKKSTKTKVDNQSVNESKETNEGPNSTLKSIKLGGSSGKQRVALEYDQVVNQNYRDDVIPPITGPNEQSCELTVDYCHDQHFKRADLMEGENVSKLDDTFNSVAPVQVVDKKSECVSAESCSNIKLDVNQNDLAYDEESSMCRSISDASLNEMSNEDVHSSQEYCNTSIPDVEYMELHSPARRNNSSSSELRVTARSVTELHLSTNTNHTLPRTVFIGPETPPPHVVNIIHQPKREQNNNNNNNNVVADDIAKDLFFSIDHCGNCDSNSSVYKVIRDLSYRGASSESNDVFWEIPEASENPLQKATSVQSEELINSHERSASDINTNSVMTSSKGVMISEDSLESTLDGCLSTDEELTPGERIDSALHTLKVELAAMRAQDVRLLKQLIAISEGIQKLGRPRMLRATKSLSLSFNKGNLLPRLQRLERQNSAPNVAERKRQAFGSQRYLSGTSDSTSSIEDSDFGSTSELENSADTPTFASSLSMLNHAPGSPESRPLHFRFRDVTLSVESLDGGEFSYEEILQRNVRIWKMNSQTQTPVIEEVPFP